MTLSYNGNDLPAQTALGCVNTSLAPLIRSRAAISCGAKLSAIETTAAPAATMPRYVVTACGVIGITIATASPGEIPIAGNAFATRAAIDFSSPYVIDFNPAE